MTTNERKGDFSRRAGRVMASPYWRREATRVANLPANPLPEEWAEIKATELAQFDEKEAFLRACEKAELFENLSPEMQKLFLTAEDWKDAEEDDATYRVAQMMSPMSATACIMDHDAEELANASA